MLKTVERKVVFAE